MPLVHTDIDEANKRIVSLERTLCIKQESLDSLKVKHKNLIKEFDKCKDKCKRRKRELEGTGRRILELTNALSQLKGDV